MRSQLGATPLQDEHCMFEVWAPAAKALEVVLGDRSVPLERDARGYFRGLVDGVPVGAEYAFRLDGGPERPDPATRLQSKGVHGTSRVVARDYPWLHAPVALNLDDQVIYELHIGTFTAEGTFDAAVPHLAGLADLGVTAIEIMPVAAFPGRFNWGYDGVGLFAVQDTYGGPDALRGFVDACHRLGLAVILDVVYNHLGPEGNYLREFGPYFTDAYVTPWGSAPNFDGRDSDEVRRFFIENALSWLRDYRIDGLRLDAIHEIKDASARPFLEQLADEVRAWAKTEGRTVALIGETDRNDPRYVAPSPGGCGLDGIWADDLHHALHAVITGERSGYYADFGRFEDIARAWNEGAVYQGQYSSFRRRAHGRALDARTDRLVVCMQNHDQIGNRMMGDRLAVQASHALHRVGLGVVLLSRWIPLLFMGEEYGEERPFQYFTDFGDPHLESAVRKGRKAEFQAFGWRGEPPDPLSEETVRACILAPHEVPAARAASTRAYVRRLLEMRRVFRRDQGRATAYPNQRTLLMQWPDGLAVANFSAQAQRLSSPIEGQLELVVASVDGVIDDRAQVLDDLSVPAETLLVFAR